MTEVIRELKALKKNKFRPIGWKKIISDLTGFGVSYVEKVFAGNRYNEKVACETITFFNSEKARIRLVLKVAKESGKP